MLTPLDHEERRKRIGASEVAAILLGNDGFKTAWDVFAAKTNRIDQSTEATSQASDMGIRLEPVVLDWAAEQLGPLDRNVRLVREDLRLGATLDAITVRDAEPVEAKTTAINGKVMEDWGDAFTDQVPDRVILQAQTQMLLAEADVCHVPTLVGGYGGGFRMYIVRRDEETIKAIVDEIPAWWAKHVESDTPPECAPSIEVARRLRREPGLIANVDPAVAAAYLEARDAAKAAEERKEEAYSLLLASMGAAEAADFGDAVKWFTFFEQDRRTLDSTRLKEEAPGLYERFSRVTKSRTLRHANRPKAAKK